MSWPVKTVLKAGAARYTAIIAGRVPIPLFAKVEAELTRIKDEGIIKAVTEPTDWCAHIATVLTKNGGLRVCVDLRKLNETVKRQLYTPPTVEDLASKFAGGKVLSTLDSANLLARVFHVDRFI